MIPIITWQTVLAITFFPDEFLDSFFEDDDMIQEQDRAAGDQISRQELIYNEEFNSQGDASRSPPISFFERERLTLLNIFRRR